MHHGCDMSSVSSCRCSDKRGTILSIRCSTCAWFMESLIKSMPHHITVHCLGASIWSSNQCKSSHGPSCPFDGPIQKTLYTTQQKHSKQGCPQKWMCFIRLCAQCRECFKPFLKLSGENGRNFSSLPGCPGSHRFWWVSWLISKMVWCSLECVGGASVCAWPYNSRWHARSIQRFHPAALLNSLGELDHRELSQSKPPAFTNHIVDWVIGHLENLLLVLTLFETYFVLSAQATKNRAMADLEMQIKMDQKGLKIDLALHVITTIE